MSDAVKAQKLASARKKFKELKKEKQQKQNNGKIDTLLTKPDGDNSRDTTPEPQQATQLVQVFDTQPQLLEDPVSFFDNSPPLITFDYNKETSEEFLKNENSLDGAQNYFENSASFFDNFVINPDNVASEEPQKTMQNLHEISNNIQKLIDPNLALTNATSLETKNQELIRELEEQKRRNEQLVVKEENDEKLEKLRKENDKLLEDNQKLLQQVEKAKNPDPKLLELLEELQRKNDEFFATIQNQNEIIAQFQHQHEKTEDNEEIWRLHTELQNHVKTIQILISEKNELAEHLTQFQNDLKQKQTENEELQGRLKTSRSRVADLEREINSYKQEVQQVRQNSEVFNSLKSDYEKIVCEKNDILQDSLEIKEKLKNVSDLNRNLVEEIEDLRKQLSLAQIKIQQITGDFLTTDSQVENDRRVLEKQVADLNEELKNAMKEKEESNLQYQQYAQQLNNQISNLATKIQELEAENSILKTQEENRVKHIGQLEKILQDLQDQPQKLDYKKDLDKVLEDLQNLNLEKLQILENYATISSERDSLQKEVLEKKREIEKLENCLEEFKSGQFDSVKLLQTMESDKVAAARAMAQNYEMKQQMEGMQEVFLKINEDKVFLTENLDMERRNNRELLEKLQKTELHLQTLAEAIEIKDNELSHLRTSSDELEKRILQMEQLNDRLRHYESQENSSSSLQYELQDSQRTIALLNQEIREIRENQENLKNRQVQENGDRIRQPEEILQVSEIEEKPKSFEDTNQNIMEKEIAMKRLEEKFLRTMEDIATLTEEKQRLEHLVLQLQGETETIGEYVALYQHQRSILKQKAHEKDQQLQQLAEDRELIRNKLDKLKHLVEKLVDNTELKQELLQQSGDQIGAQENGVKNDAEVAEIIDLLSEIKTSNLVQPTSDFHHCPCCHGQLITV